MKFSKKDQELQKIEAKVAKFLEKEITYYIMSDLSEDYIASKVNEYHADMCPEDGDDLKEFNYKFVMDEITRLANLLAKCYFKR